MVSALKIAPSWIVIGSKRKLNRIRCLIQLFAVFVLMISGFIFYIRSDKKEVETSTFRFNFRNLNWDLKKNHNPAPSENCKSVRFGTLIYVPNRFNNYYLIQLATFLYASWIHIYRFAGEYLKDPTCMNVVDLIIYCQEPSCNLLPADCVHYTKVDPNYKSPKCYFQEIKPFNTKYQAMNSFVFVLDPNFEETIVPQYDYFIRTDIDAFLGPAILTWIPEKSFLTGPGGYCHSFNKMMMIKIAKELGLRSQGMPCFGPSWIGESHLLYNVSLLTTNLTEYVYDNEFNVTKRPEISKYVNENNTNGAWPQWWRPTSLLYGQELAINHLL